MAIGNTFKILLLCVLLTAKQSMAQIGYQVSLLNTATGEPQANKTVNVNISITNSENEIVHTEIQTATTNDFGILSLSVGKENTFKNTDWNKLPFYIAATVNGALIGKSQILTVPVAEYAKTAGTVLTKEMVVGTWGYEYTYKNNDGYSYTRVEDFTLNDDGTGVYHLSIPGNTWNMAIHWKIRGNVISLYAKTEDVMRANNYILISSSVPFHLLLRLIYDAETNKLHQEGNSNFFVLGIFSKK